MFYRRSVRRPFRISVNDCVIIFSLFRPVRNEKSWYWDGRGWQWFLDHPNHCTSPTCAFSIIHAAWIPRDHRNNNDDEEEESTFYIGGDAAHRDEMNPRFVAVPTTSIKGKGKGKGKSKGGPALPQDAMDGGSVRVARAAVAPSGSRATRGASVNEDTPTARVPVSSETASPYLVEIPDEFSSNFNDEDDDAGYVAADAASVDVAAAVAMDAAAAASADDPIYDGSKTSEARILLKLADILPQTTNKYLLKIMRDELSKADPSLPQTESHFVSRIVEAIENEPSEDLQKAVDILERDLPEACSFLVDHFGIIREIFATRKPEVIAGQIVRLTGEFPFDRTKGNDSYVSLIMENLFSQESSGEGRDDSPERSDDAAAPPPPMTETDLPAHWQDTESGYALVEVDSGCREVAALVASWNIVSPIIKIMRVQNRDLWRQFQFHRSMIAARVGEADLNERHLWHGTNEEAVKSISIEGFDHRVGVRNGRIWGDGIYLTIHPEFALRYSSRYLGGQMASFLRSQYNMANVTPPAHLANLPPLPPPRKYIFAEAELLCN